MDGDVLGWVAVVVAAFAVKFLLGVAWIAICDVTGFSAWARRVHLDERQVLREDAYHLALFTAVGGLGTTAIALGVLLLGSGSANTRLSVAALVVGVIISCLGALLTMRWWRITAYYLP